MLDKDTNKVDQLLGQDVRVRRVSRMIPLSGSLPAPLVHQIRTAAEDFMRVRKLSQKDVADAIGSSTTYVSNLFGNAASLPESTRDRLWRDINNWLEREARAEANERPDDFVPTIHTAESLMLVAEQLTRRADMAVAYGPAGIGKTVTIRAIVAETPTAVAITAGYDTRTPKKLLRVILAALTSRRKRGEKADVDLDEVAERLRMPARVKSRNLLIIDQGHELIGHEGCWRVLMELHDRAGCSVLLVGTVDLKSHVATDEDPEFGQLSSRVGMRINLAPELAHSLRGSGKRGDKKCFTVGDIRKLFAAGKLKLHPDAARMLCEVANTRRGTLRRVTRLYAWGEHAARDAGSDTIRVEDLRAAAVLVEEDEDLPVRVEGEPAETTAVAAG